MKTVIKFGSRKGRRMLLWVATMFAKKISAFNVPVAIIIQLN